MTDKAIEAAARAACHQANYCHSNEARVKDFQEHMPYWTDIAKAAIEAYEAALWIKISKTDDLPKKPGIDSYEHVDCLCVHKGTIKNLLWNCEHEVWDDTDGDDYFCDPLEVSMYRPLPTPPKENA